MSQPAQSFAAARDGARLAYRLLPGTTGRRFVLSHSLAMDSEFWTAVAAPLRAAGDVLVYDSRGHGASDKGPGPYSAEQFADDMATVMDAAGWFSAEVAGCSMGGCVALAFAEAYPERVEALGLFNTTAWNGPDAPAAWEARGQKAVQDGLASLVDMQMTRWFTDQFRAARPDVVATAAAVFLANDPKLFLESCRMLGVFDKRAALAHISVPTTVIVGSEDQATPVAMAEALQAGIAGASLRIIDGARHLTPLECPELIAAALIDLGREP